LTLYIAVNFKGQRRLAEASKEGLGSKWAVVPMMMMKSRRQMGRTCSRYGVEKKCIHGFSGET
jgi:hypothetical protein